MDDVQVGRTGMLPAGALDALDDRAAGGAVSRRTFLTAAGMSFVAASLAACAGGGDSTGPGGVMGGGSGMSGSGGSSGATLPPGVTVSGGVVTVNLVSQATLASAGGFLLLNSGAIHAMVINLGSNTFKAFTSVCTHDGCANSWAYNGVRFQCGCHGSEFDTNGAVTIGPASSPLTSYPAAFDMATNSVVITTAP